MAAPEILALPLEEAGRRLAQAGCSWEVQPLLPPRESLAAYTNTAVRKYVVRQQELSANKLVLTVVYRKQEGGATDGSEN